jgi:hypothetical protein
MWVHNPAGKPCRHPKAPSKPPNYPHHRPITNSLSLSSRRQPLIQMFLNGDDFPLFCGEQVVERVALFIR